ncbi:hypothetical protein FEK30_01280 [Picosynechococcus sp. PCC 11901]|uniref:DUF5331 domain-containing protein n=1 Tax=Picosynechococcus sp. PCC 11901 TaxID=2579791 RepID=UPI0010FC0397|nr:DUF5331 domain-containing protein [Picosynechococcus sp. PCC 11901]QCS48175.1 hypothetical protein FEK30_01280 [Picosynechococcus sp. PCC 11901]
MNFTQELEKLKHDICEKWLDYCQRNEEWICTLMNANSLWRNTNEEIDQYLIEADQEKFESWNTSRPNADFIIGVVSNFNLEAQSLIGFTTTLSTNRDVIIQSLGLNFDPFLEIERRKFSQSQQATLIPASSELDDIREQIKQNSGEIT